MAKPISGRGLSATESRACAHEAALAHGLLAMTRDGVGEAFVWQEGGGHIHIPPSRTSAGKAGLAYGSDEDVSFSLFRRSGSDFVKFQVDECLCPDMAALALEHWLNWHSDLAVARMPCLGLSRPMLHR